jgi:hypothetical protein
MMAVVDRGELLGWCVVANVAGAAPGDERAHRSGGTRHFSAGTKVWVLPPQWGDGGEKVLIVGRHRGQRNDLVRMVVRRRDLVSFRARGVYSPTVLKTLVQPWRPDIPQTGIWRSQADAQEAAHRWNTTTATRSEPAPVLATTPDAANSTVPPRPTGGAAATSLFWSLLRRLRRPDKNA